MVCRSSDVGYYGGGAGTMASSTTYETANPEGAGLQSAMNGATVSMTVSRTAAAITAEATVTPSNGENEFTMSYSYTYKSGEDNTADIYLTFGVEYAYLSLTSVTYTPADYGDKTLETYNFKVGIPGTSTGCTSGDAISVDGSTDYVLYNAAKDLQERFAGGATNGNVSLWLFSRGGGGFRNGASNTSKSFALLNLAAGDYVTINYSKSDRSVNDIKFRGDNNISGYAKNTDLVSGNTYKIITAGDLSMEVGRDVVINSVVIATSAPILATPTISFNNMVASEGLYYPQVNLGSNGEDGVTFKNGSGETITSPYTFTSAGTLTVYTVKAGRTKSKKTTYTVENGWILANSVNCKALAGAIDYSSGNVLSNGRFDNIGHFLKQIVPGLEFSGNQWYASANGIYAGSGNRDVSCTVLNSNRIATFKHYDYDISAEKYDYLTSVSNTTTIKRQGGDNPKNDYLREYNLFVKPSETVPVTIGTTGFSTFSCPLPLDFSSVTGLKAYVAKSVVGENVNFTPVETAPANTGLLLEGTAGVEYTIPVSASVDAPASNLLVGCIVETAVAADATSKFNNYVLVNESGTAKFQSLVANGANINAGKAFLKNGAYSAGAHSLNIVFEDESTGIKQIETAKQNVENYYNLAGQRIIQPTKGLYIVNGKKVVIK